MADSIDTIVVGAGNIGIAVAYYLTVDHGVKNVILVDPLPPMSLTSAASGENYRNWWPHPVMTAYTDHSTDLLEKIALDSRNRINMTRRGYVLVTRRPRPQDLLNDLSAGYGSESPLIRIHENANSSSYQPPVSSDWVSAPSGVDVLTNAELIQRTFPMYAKDIATAIHIRRAGTISGQQLGQFMLEAICGAGGKIIRGKVVTIEKTSPFLLRLDTGAEIKADRVVNAAGPFFSDIAKLVGDNLPVKTVFQQKISFEDTEKAVPRNLPFSIDLDPQHIAWTEEEESLLREDPANGRFLQLMPGAIHCRPEGPEAGKWIKLGWAYNQTATDAHLEDPIDHRFPEIVLRGASRLNSGLAKYVEKLPRHIHHYGGYYTMTDENWPLIGPSPTKGMFLAGAMSGFGTMAACASGDLCARWMVGKSTPDYARHLSLERYNNAPLLREIAQFSERSIL